MFDIFKVWFWYSSEDRCLLETHKCGKWMMFFNDQEFAKQICAKAIEQEVCYECKCANLLVQKTPSGVICFYLNCDDIENHYRVIDFMLENNMIRKKKNGEYYNLSFQFDDQTYAKEYGKDLMH